MNEKWDKRFLLLAEHISKWSRDPSTQCGAVIVRPDKSVCSVGFNGFPRGMNDDPALYNHREVKYDRIIHAEMNAILSANEPVRGNTLYVWPFLTCNRCAVHAIQAGIVRVVAPLDDNPRWAKSFDQAIDYYSEAGVEVELYDAKSLSNRVSEEPGNSPHCRCN